VVEVKSFTVATVNPADTELKLLPKAGGREFVMKSDTAKDRQDWVNAINNVLYPPLQKTASASSFVI